jgi:Domain of unknown function (DUF4214)/Sulfotransferase family
MKLESFCQTTNCLNDEEFLQQVYQTYLKRDPDEDGKNLYLLSLQEGKLDRQQLVTSFSQSPEFHKISQFEKIISHSPWLEVVSYHIPQTAGCTFGRILEQVYGAENIVHFYGESSITTEKYTSQAKAIHGQFQARKYDITPFYYQTIIWLKHPIIRLISLYYFWKSTPSVDANNEIHKYLISNDLDILEFARIAAVQNEMSAYFCGKDITEFGFVGIEEFFAEDVEEIKKLMNWSDFPIPIVNKNYAHNYSKFTQTILSDKTLVKQLISLNFKDMELYQRALELRAKRKGLLNLLEQFKLQSTETFPLEVNPK